MARPAAKAGDNRHAAEAADHTVDDTVTGSNRRARPIVGMNFRTTASLQIGLLGLTPRFRAGAPPRIGFQPRNPDVRASTHWQPRFAESHPCCRPGMRPQSP